MQRKTRIWVGLGAAVLVSATATGSSAVATAVGSLEGLSVKAPPAAPGSPRVLVAQADTEGGAFEGGEGGEGEGGEGGGQVLGTITEFRLQSMNPGAYAYDASPQVMAYGGLVHDTYVAAHAGARTLQDAIAALLADPTDATLAAAREAWVAGHVAYSRTEAYLFYAGPVDIPGGPIKRLNAWPVDPAFIDGLLDDTATALNRAAIVRVDQLETPTDVATGWHAIEYVLWGEDPNPDGPGTRPAADFGAGVGNNDRRRDYLAIVSQLLTLDLSTLVAAWAPDANNYRASVVAMDQRNAIGRAFNGMAVLAGYEVAMRRISAGLFQTDRQYEQSQFSDTTTAAIIADVAGIKAVYYGGGVEGAGFDALLAELDPALNDRVVAAMARAEAAVGGLAVPYDAILSSPSGSPERAQASEAVAALKDLAGHLRAAGNRLGVLVLIPGI